MKRLSLGILAAGLAGSLVNAADPALTIYNQNFAVVRDSVRLNLRAGTNVVRFANTTAQLEPDSVILRDPSGARRLQILEQNFRADPVSQELLLSIFEGRTIEFQVSHGDKPPEIITGRVVRSGYVPRYYGQDGYQPPIAPGASQPIIEVNGKLRFSLPGEPIFPALTDDTILKPTLSWVIQSDKAGAFDGDLSYITSGMSWEADYNVLAPEQGDTLDLVGWVTMNNQSGKTFEKATIKLMAGDVNKVQPQANNRFVGRYSLLEAKAASPPVSEKTFDEYHLYTLQRATTLRDHETKQVEFVRASGIQSKRLYVYDSGRTETPYYAGLRTDPEYGVQSNTKVAVMREFVNSQANQLGMPLPKGRIRFYRQNTGGAAEFTGENTIEHTPRDERLRFFTGDAFDVVGERKRENFRVDQNRRTMEESFEIKLRNRKQEVIEVRVVERLNRAANWEITAKSDDFAKQDSHTIEFLAKLKPDEERKVTYTVRYTW
ncbi:MAG TPA: DUF4139 domain-containing protein [Verrucomicrobiae bacterium]|nr:DUF4139 domain-containing protein [Verrucomicrobiae bacterium]